VTEGPPAPACVYPHAAETPATRHKASAGSAGPGFCLPSCCGNRSNAAQDLCRLGRPRLLSALMLRKPQQRGARLASSRPRADLSPPPWGRARSAQRFGEDQRRSVEDHDVILVGDRRPQLGDGLVNSGFEDLYFCGDLVAWVHRSPKRPVDV
jgi:hypothetical protein